MASFKTYLLLLSVLPMLGAAQAATITVDAGGACALADAITAANSDTAAGGCSAGSGTDTIVLEKDVTLIAALPEITSTVTIECGGHFISGNNDASVGRVLIITASGNLTLNNTTIKDGIGGGIYNGGTISLNNSTISSNSSSCGGGIRNYGTATLNNSTVSGNRATIICVSGVEGTGSGTTGGGILNSGTITLQSSIVSGNIGQEIASWESGTITADSWNVFGHRDKSNAQAFNGFTPGSKDITATSDGNKPTALSAILSPLAADGVHALVASSPAIDADMTCSTGLTTDQQGQARPLGAGCDAGAVEYNPSNTDSDSDGLPDASDNCPLMSNSDQKDTDSDGKGDLCDDDLDGDGVVNSQDNCPIVTNANQKDTDNDGIGDTCDSYDDRVNMSPVYKLLLRN